MEKNRLVFGRNFVFILSVAAFLISCSSRPCREPRLPELDQTVKKTDSKSNLSVGAPVQTPSAGAANADTASTDAEPVRVRVYKPDGSRQCENRGENRGEKSGAVKLEVMERELAGIVVHAREKKTDGLMHIQICGSPTGMINIYEIDLTYLKQAEERGFKRLED